MIIWLLTAHIAVLGYWLGSELVINSTYRLVCFADDMPFAERERLMNHVMHVDQHVRYALVLQVVLGVMLAASYGFIPGGQSAVVATGVFGLAWLAFIEAVHRLRKRPVGELFARIDRSSRYVLIALLLAVAIGALGDTWPIPEWLRWKLIAFAGVIACGVGIRFALMGHFKVWAKMAAGDTSAANHEMVKKTYARATSILVLLWVFIGAVVFLSVAKPV